MFITMWICEVTQNVTHLAKLRENEEIGILKGYLTAVPPTGVTTRSTWPQHLCLLRSGHDICHVLDPTLCMFSKASGELHRQLRQLAVGTETYSDKFQGNTGGHVRTSCMLGGFGFSPHQQAFSNQYVSAHHCVVAVACFPDVGTSK